MLIHDCRRLDVNLLAGAEQSEEVRAEVVGRFDFSRAGLHDDDDGYGGGVFEREVVDLCADVYREVQEAEGVFLADDGGGKAGIRAGMIYDLGDVVSRAV
jgi:hypothetical protein